MRVQQRVGQPGTVPGDPAKHDGAASDSVLESKARSTWHGEFWKLGGGGTTWDGMAYDPKLDLLYFGTDNGAPWNHAVRGGGDNLFTSSIIAVRPDTGQYVWHYQNTPGESWDYSAVQQMTLADLKTSISLDVSNAVQRIDTLQHRLETAQQSRKFAEQGLEVEQSRLDAGKTTSFSVLDFQRKASDARTRELAARVDLKKAEAELWAACGLFLQKHGFATGETGAK